MCGKKFNENKDQGMVMWPQSNFLLADANRVIVHEISCFILIEVRFFMLSVRRLNYHVSHRKLICIQCKKEKTQDKPLTDKKFVNKRKILLEINSRTNM